ncbi:META domain-containing protein [Niabella drilacis]|uniref:META domain-containing protein n=1 Tax=Niabella drilacis (strain DSM 25811 / CCM 8410 / CCUG 62505 / LMG 26954 / E90) TaxID=1285928 RepID=A0A1G6V6S9_NIADE|nr:META domain-containing protein [Niabella drilacis]SDD48575.1 META domain-containing protein [Niabella drilacis]
MRRLFFSVMLALGLLMTGCSKKVAEKKEDRSGTLADLQGNWAISYLKDVPVIRFDGTKTAYSIINFDAASGIAFAGCNRISFGVSVPGEQGMLAVDQLIVTNLACGPYAATETAILSSLENAHHFSVKDRQLALFDKKGTVLLMAGKIAASD